MLIGATLLALVDWEFEIHHSMRDFSYDMHSPVTEATEEIHIGMI